MSRKIQPIQEHRISNGKGTMSVSVLNLGAIISSVLVTNSYGKQIETVLNYKDIESYGQNDSYLGALVGRTSGRIAWASFYIEDISYHLEVNDGSNNLHGGDAGLSKIFWRVKEKSASRIVMETDCGHLEGGYPGNVHCEVEYRVFDTTLEIKYFASTDQDTYIDLTNHSYFNLEGDATQAIYDHELQLNCDKYCPVDDANLPIEIYCVSAHKGYDYRERRPMKFENQPFVGIDHPFIINDDGGFTGRLRSNKSGLELLVSTDCPAVVIYTGNHLEVPHSGICFETQELPNNINSEMLPVAITTKEQPFRRFTKFEFSVL